MTTLAWVAVAVLVVGLVLVAGGWRRATRRLAGADAAVHDLERRLDAVEAASARALDTARDAAALARRVSGEDDPGPRVVLEPVTGPLVKAVAFGVGARRAMTRLARPTGGRR